MKFITDRHEIAQEINIKKTPVVTVNIKECMSGYEHCYEGQAVRINIPGKDFDLLCKVQMFGDDSKNLHHHENPAFYETIGLYSETIGIHASFGVSDVRKMVERSRCPEVNLGDEIIVVFDKGDAVWIRKMRIPKKINMFVFPVGILEDVE